MNCSEFKSEMNNFINNTIDEDNIESFITHYKSCKSCNEELEIYYMVNKTFNQDFDEGNTVSIPDSYDFKKRLNRKVAYYDDMIYRRYKTDFFFRLAVIGTEIISVAFAVYFILVFCGGSNV